MKNKILEGKMQDSGERQQFEKVNYRINHIENRNIRTPNEIVVYGTYAEIILYNQLNQEVDRATIDIDKIDLIKEYKWYLGSDGYVRSGELPLYLHRIIMNCPEELVIDHIEANPLKNICSNLRFATDSQNMMNRSLQSNNTSKVTGVVWNKDRNKWQSQIKVNKKNIYLGRFFNFEDAVKARKEAEEKYFGEFKKVREEDIV